MRILGNLREYFAPFHDPRAWTLIAICVGVVWLFDPIMAKTLVQWVFFFGALCGFAIMISRHTLPQISLTEMVSRAGTGNVGAGLVVLGLLIFLGAIILSLTIWGKA